MWEKSQFSLREHVFCSIKLKGLFQILCGQSALPQTSLVNLQLRKQHISGFFEYLIRCGCTIYMPLYPKRSRNCIPLYPTVWLVSLDRYTSSSPSHRLLSKWDVAVLSLQLLKHRSESAQIITTRQVWTHLMVLLGFLATDMYTIVFSLSAAVFTMYVFLHTYM